MPSVSPLNAPIPPVRSRVLRAARQPNDRLPHPSWRAATGHAAAMSGRLGGSARDFWERLGL
ncbi:hypothetical protein GCM10011614_09790 [Novosphingobium colocasiae]|uniref:Uncharacterized protein n=1 Tax=Novosphingobium colocasiae TaxID=1256513 RepID=A0A918UEQ2_9SPHN|nr:hypothetical protein GCM10011614_09790 [Novosphingobium colocasiae]